MTENEHPKPDKRANVSATELLSVTTRREKELACSPAYTTELHGR
jgi:hypothetical protein